jgi:dTDP-glucose pyrophosphorylase
MEIIVPCAGLSTRFPNMRPKYLLTDYRGKLMIENAIQPFLNNHNITIAILKEHDEKFKAQQKLRDVFGDLVNIVVLEKPTNGPADTVFQTICIQKEINLKDQLLIKDCDSFYDANIIEGNAIYIFKLSKNKDIRNASAKSYTITNNQNIITTVVEKQIVSDNFCVGGYQFETVDVFFEACVKLKLNATSELFVSNVIDYLVSNGHVFVESEVDNFVDVGTSEDWFKYNNKPTYFCDIDGTIVKTKDFHYEDYEPIIKNVDALLKKQSLGCKFVFCTARNKKFEELTKNMLDELGFRNYTLLMEIYHSKRIVINDYASTNPYPSAIAINLKRDSDNLGELI